MASHKSGLVHKAKSITEVQFTSRALAQLLFHRPALCSTLENRARSLEVSPAAGGKRSVTGDLGL